MIRPASEYRKICFDEHGKECHFCDESRVEVHHINGDRADNSPENLLPVCKAHHAKIHSNANGFGEWHDKLLPPSERTATSSKEHYIGIDGWTEKVFEELRSVYDLGRHDDIIHLALSRYDDGSWKSERQDVVEIEREIFVRPKRAKKLSRLDGFESKESALKSVVIGYWESRQQDRKAMSQYR